VFKRRKPDDPTAADAALPAGLVAEEADDPVPGQADLVTAAPGDDGLGVPPFRPAAPKQEPAMSNPPFSFGANLAAPSTPATGGSSPNGSTSGGASPAQSSLAAPPRPAAVPLPSPPPVASERRTLVVGRGISVQGTVQDAERLVVEGMVEASMIHATELAISTGGMVKGEVEVVDAEIAGTFDGTLTARGNLVIRASGRVLGQARCRRLQVEDGGQISGHMEMLTDGAKAEAPVRALAEHAA
jgi:cytoskeletal protein CcmA (bactofilin family)